MQLRTMHLLLAQAVTLQWVANPNAQHEEAGTQTNTRRLTVVHICLEVGLY